jgi:hypothetical protein
VELRGRGAGDWVRGGGCRWSIHGSIHIGRYRVGRGSLSYSLQSVIQSDLVVETMDLLIPPCV